MTYLVDVVVQWHDEQKPFATKVAVDEPFDPLSEVDDLGVFYYFESEAELEQAKQDGDNGFEFRILEEE